VLVEALVDRRRHDVRDEPARLEASDALGSGEHADRGEVAGRAVIEVEDLATGTRLPPSDVLIWTLDGARLVVRPSGTEPKLKIYAEAVVPVDDDVVSARRAAATIVDEILVAATALLTSHGL